MIRPVNLCRLVILYYYFKSHHVTIDLAVMLVDSYHPQQHI
ncbi:unnamed protein product [Trichobilharzia regenti]|nr:unnamed protein product [Trichobilharzia regenti]